MSGKSGSKALLPELFSVSLYKANQGRMVRQFTFFGIAVVAAFGCITLGNGPLVPAALFRQVRTIFPSSIRSTAAPSEVQHAALSLSLAITWLILHLSGKNMGEAARLWTFLTPWWIVMLCTANAATGKTQPVRNWRILLIAQLVACLLTTSLISGYSTL